MVTCCGQDKDSEDEEESSSEEEEEEGDGKQTKNGKWKVNNNKKSKNGNHVPYTFIPLVNFIRPGLDTGFDKYYTVTYLYISSVEGRIFCWRECLGRSFAYVAHFVFLRYVLI
jgi:hypothetical protein